MSNIIGIDLGTTYSVIAVYGEVISKGNYPPTMFIPECNVTLIPDQDGTFAIPSAFWCNPDNPSEKVFGYDAKELSKERKTPILFSKRSIGTTEILKIGDKEFTAKEVATEYLMYLKKCAEVALGQPVKWAVITHPAYFSLNQVEETKQAAIDAGFDMSDNEQMQMEPVAAAMAFIAADPREELTVLVYDLGGGTFDVTVLEKKWGVITSKAFDGNHLLGGYNFDKVFLNWLLGRVRNRLKESGRTFEITEDNSSDKSTWSRLLQIAEKLKIDLTNKPTSKAPVAISINDVLYDTDGKSIQIIDRINRDEYTAEISILLEDTIEKSNNAIKKAGLANSEIDLILLVGGSSHGQWVKEAVQNAFPENEVMQHDSPDLVVAMGAAIISESIGGEKVKEPVDDEKKYDYSIVVDIPSKSNLQTLHIIGSVNKSKGDKIESSQLDEFYLMIRPDDSNNGAVKLNEDGNYIFRDVELLDEEDNNFIIELYDSNAILRGKKTYTIKKGDCPPPPPQFVPKSIFIKTADGLITIAKEADRLPVKSKEIRLVKLNNDPTIYMDIYQENDWVTTIAVEGIPEDAGEGSKVILNIEITKKNIMRGNVVVKNPEGKVVTEWPIEIAFPPIYIPDMEELKDKFEKLEDKRQQDIYLERDPARRAKLGGGDKIVIKIKALFAAEGIPDRQEINQAIKELENLFTIKKEEFEPPLEEFNKLISECENIINAKSDAGENQTENFDKLDRINRARDEAQLTKDKRKWAYSYELLLNLYKKLQPTDNKVVLLETPVQKYYAYENIVVNLNTRLEQKKKRIEADGKYKPEKHEKSEQAINKKITELKLGIENIPDDTKPEVAQGKLSLIYVKKPTIEKLINEFGEDLKTERF